MGDQHDGPPLALETSDTFQAFALEWLVTDGEDLVDEQDVRIDVDGDRKSEAHVHAGRVELDLRVDEALDTGEVDDLVEVPIGLFARQPEDRRVEIDVLPAGQVWVEARAELEQSGQPSPEANRSGRRLEDSADHLEQRAIA